MRSYLPLLAAIACAPETVEPAPETTVLLVRSLAFEPIVDGTSRGFDLDGAEGMCGVPDYPHPEGGGSIDNSFALLLPALDAVGGDALPELVQASVTSGELLLLIEEQDLGDGCTAVAVMRGHGAPDLGSDNLILPGQTFDIDANKPASLVTCAERSATGILADGFQIHLPLEVFDEVIDLTLLEGVIETRASDDGAVEGVLAGRVLVSEVQENVASFDGIPQAIHDLFGVALTTRADLGPDPTGACTSMSAVLTFEAVPAFIYEDSPRPASVAVE